MDRFNLEALESRQFLSAVSADLIATPGADDRSAAAIDMAAVAASPLAGLVVTGTYTTSSPNPDTGVRYHLSAAAHATASGDVTVRGHVHTPGNIAVGRAHGQLHVTTSNGTIDLFVKGPKGPGAGPFPSTLKYTITGATGAFAGMTGHGTINAVVGTGPHHHVKLTFHPA